MRVLSKDTSEMKGTSGVPHDDGYTISRVNKKREMLPKLMSLTLRSVGCDLDEIDKISAMKSHIRFCTQVHNDIRDIFPTGGAP